MPVHVQQRVVRHERRVEQNLHGFAVPGASSADFVVRRVGFRAARARVAAGGRQDAGQHVEGFLHAPEAAARERRRLQTGAGRRRRQIRGRILRAVQVPEVVQHVAPQREGHREVRRVQERAAAGNRARPVGGRVLRSDFGGCRRRRAVVLGGGHRHRAAFVDAATRCRRRGVLLLHRRASRSRGGGARAHARDGAHHRCHFGNAREALEPRGRMSRRASRCDARGTSAASLVLSRQSREHRAGRSGKRRRDCESALLL